MSEEIKKNNFKIKFLSLIKNNFKKIISFLILLIIFLFIYLFYTNVQKKNEIKISEQYTEASIQFKQKKINSSKLLFENIINKDHRFYSPLALYFIIDNNLENEREKIIKFFDKILKINSIDKENINLIKIKKAIFLFSVEDEELLIKTLNPIINSDSIWRNMAIELISNYFLSKNQKTKAEEYIQLLNNKTNK
jgi:predicted negative regulator of RcsB-dependent stress response